MRAWQVVALGLMLLIVFPSNTAAPVEELDVGFIVGGQWTNASNSSTASDSFVDLPALVEDYTATWCTNCVDVEHALNEIPSQYLQQYHFHRAIGETEDPFGSVALDERWEDRYGLRIPPTVVFNGYLKKIGSVADGESLKDDYDELTNSTPPMDEGSTQFVWTPAGESGIVAWNVNISSNVLANYSLDVQVWFVESGATFEEGSNQLGYYPHIVREIHSLGNATNGSETLPIPVAFDGDDVEVHLMYEFKPIVLEGCCDEPMISDDDSMDNPLPYLGLIDIFAIIAIVVTLKFKRLL